MIITEEEAKSKLCVDFMSASVPLTTLYPESWNNCQVSKCMAWKWKDDNEKYGCCGKVYPNIR